MLPEMAPLAYLAALGLFAGAIIYSELLDRDATDDPFGDGVQGDIPFIPQDLKICSFHGRKDDA
jgi:hypothetical protein